MGSTLVTPPVVKVRALFCPNCGGTVQLHGYAHTLSVVCSNCKTVLDTSTPTASVLQQAQTKLNREPTIPLGTRGKFYDTVYQAIGFQARQTEVDGDIYEWNEYVLFNPYNGFRYLVEYRGHWNFVNTVKFLPAETTRGGRRAAMVRGRTYLHFQTATAKTAFVMGEFPWRVHVGEEVSAMDYIAPPDMLSAEGTENELVWSHGEYMTGAQIWQAFQCKGQPPSAAGIYANQPNPYRARARSVWRVWFWMLMLLISVAAVLSMFARDQIVLDQNYHFQAGTPGEPAFVTPVFDLQGHPSNVRIDIKTDLNNNWTYFGLALINNDTGEAFDFGREVSYYSGYDSDGRWTEGSDRDSATIPAVLPGRYYLRVEPEMDAAAARSLRAVNYEIVVRRDVPNFTWYWIAALLLLIPPIVTWYRSFSFERARWLESDYGTPAGLLASAKSGDD
jgi:hypothetical protein